MLELEMIDKMIDYVDKDTFSRVCSYIVGCIPYVSPPDDIAILQTAHQVYRKFGRFADALQLAIKLRDTELIHADMNACEDRFVTLVHDINLMNRCLKRQLAFLLARSLITFETEDEELLEILSNAKLHEHFASLARDLDILEPKTPEDIYKRHLENISIIFILSLIA
jgi:26S proteasome regulatory subunit N1